jgi:glycerol-3-phosphate acyltransferase PlsY
MTFLLKIIWPIGAYFLGSIPFGLLLARYKGINLLKYGSGNIGATNVTRIIGKRWGLLALIADFLKGFLPVIACMQVMAGEPDLDFWIAFTGISSVLGHCYSIFLGFKGGKGVATAAGVLTVICPFAISIALIVFIIVLAKWGYVSAGSLASATFTAILMYFLCPVLELKFMAWVIACVIWIRHVENIKRLTKGEEKGWKTKSPLLNS